MHQHLSLAYNNSQPQSVLRFKHLILCLFAYLSSTAFSFADETAEAKQNTAVSPSIEIIYSEDNQAMLEAISALKSKTTKSLYSNEEEYEACYFDFKKGGVFDGSDNMIVSMDDFAEAIFNYEIVNIHGNYNWSKGNFGDKEGVSPTNLASRSWADRNRAKLATAAAALALGILYFNSQRKE